MNINEVFRKFAAAVSTISGSPYTFVGAIIIIGVWASTGPVFGFSDTWQLVINTGTTIITFLMVFIIQNTQNRDSKAIHLKLDELLKGVKGARTGMVDIENLNDEELETLHKQFQELHQKYEYELKKRKEK